MTPQHKEHTKMGSNRLKLLLVSMMAVFAISAVASASSASAFEFRWWGCKEAAGTGTKYTEHLCKEASGTGKWEWVKEVAGEKWATTSKGGPFRLTAAGKTVTCKKVKDEGFTEGSGEDLATKITFEECSTGQTGCKVRSAGGTFGTIVVEGLKTQLRERETAAKAKVLADEFKENATTKQFVTLQFEPEPGKSCSEYTETKVRGEVAAECKNLANGEVELNFPEKELKGNTLEAFGVAAKLEGKATELWSNGWGLQCR
jgi:hypothetical protein